MPRYAALIYGAPEVEAPDTAEWETVMTDYYEFGANNEAAILGGEALEGVETATTVTVPHKGGEITTTDGPFAETKEVLGGFYLLQADDLDAAVKIAAQIPGAWAGKVEVRPIMEIPDAE